MQGCCPRGSDENEDDPVTIQNDSVNKILFDKVITGLSMEKGMTRFGGDREAYIEVLKSYVDSTPSLLSVAKSTHHRLQLARGIVRDELWRADLADYETVIHGIKGSSRAIFANDVGNKAEALENAAKHGDFEFITANNDDLIETSSSLITEINIFLSELLVISLKTAKNRPDKEILEKLREACLNYDMNTVDEAISELESFSYNSDNELVEWLRRNAEQASFDEIVERLSE